jgi:hypothetical protein
MPLSFLFFSENEMTERIRKSLARSARTSKRSPTKHGVRELANLHEDLVDHDHDHHHNKDDDQDDDDDDLSVLRPSSVNLKSLRATRLSTITSEHED